MELMEAIRARKSYRNQFEDTPVPRNDLREILEAGVAAPSGCNMQTTQFIGVDDPVLVKRCLLYTSMRRGDIYEVCAAVCQHVFIGTISFCKAIGLCKGLRPI